MKLLINNFFQLRFQPKEISWFRKSLYILVLYKVIVFVLHFDTLFSETNLIYNAPMHVNFVTDLAFALSNYYSSSAVLFILCSMCFLSFLGLFNYSNYVTNALLWLMVINIHNYIYPCLTGGDYLLNQLLMFNVFFSFKANTNLVIENLKIALHNTVLCCIKIQICLVYFVSALYKLSDASWLDGTALSQISHVPEFSTYLFSSLPDFFMVVCTYLTIAYQLLFPVLIWIRPFKIYLFAFGIMQHVIIAALMGLFGFSAIMLLCYILFLKYDYKF